MEGGLVGRQHFADHVVENGRVVAQGRHVGGGEAERFGVGLEDVGEIVEPDDQLRVCAWESHRDVPFPG